MTHPSAWHLAEQALKHNQTAVLVAVVHHHGSVPGKTGALMVVTDDAVEGTVGGGLVEHQLIELSRQNPQVQLFPFTHSGEGSNSICSGHQTFAILPLTSTHLEAIATLSAMDAEGRAGALTLNPAGPSIEPDITRVQSFAREEDDWSFVTPVGPLDTLTIVGGGHVSMALSRVMATLPFRIVVLDDRENLPTLARNAWAHAIHQVQWSNVAHSVVEGDRSWAVIMTRGHRHDAEVLRNLLPLDLYYLGMMGSTAKVHQIFTELERDGVLSADLDRVHAPIGVPIASSTPEEIAISVAAEIIQLRGPAGNPTGGRHWGFRPGL